MLKIENLSVEVENHRVLNDIDFLVDEGETYMVFGPNGGGKSSLMYTLMGYPEYRITQGKIEYNGRDLSELDISTRSIQGIGLGVQHPPVIKGVTLGDMLRHCLGESSDYCFRASEQSLIDDFGMNRLLDRKLNQGFSGGEQKRAEVLQILFQRPRLMLLDEPDSGVDIESLTTIAQAIQRYLVESGASAMIITHKGKILDYIKADKACVIMDGGLHCYNEPNRIFSTIQTYGYSHCLECSKSLRCTL